MAPACPPRTWSPPGALVQVLEQLASSPEYALYREALPGPGEMGTTLESRLPELRGRLHAKTGTLTNVTSLSGYLDTDGGRTVVFSILTNGSGLPSATMREAIDRLVLEAARRW
jgi:serine-type D-Ala-D-Ala carboxypeptidase/endopeptidase (penicillin-binding protein 4)